MGWNEAETRNKEELAGRGEGGAVVLSCSTGSLIYGTLLFVFPCYVRTAKVMLSISHISLFELTACK